MPTAFYSPAACRGHDMGAGHPECPQRLDAVLDQLRASGLDALLDRRDAPDATTAQLVRAHDAGYVAELLARIAPLADSGERLALDPDTTASPGTHAAALQAAGAAVAATDAVLRGEVANAFCAIRPPGHHATRGQTMGFCFFNNVAVAARHALEVHGLERVAIVDFDVHHGNGTEDIVAGDPRILMTGIFQSPLYPDCGEVPLGDNMANVPIPPGSDGMAVRAAFEATCLPRLEAFRPQLVFVSAGFDAHREDPLAQLALTEADYDWLTRRLLEVAARHAQGRLVSCLEGGYALGALGRSAAVHVKALVEA